MKHTGERIMALFVNFCETCIQFERVVYLIQTFILYFHTIVSCDFPMTMDVRTGELST